MEFRRGDTLILLRADGSRTSFEREVTKVTPQYLTLRATRLHYAEPTEPEQKRVLVHHTEQVSVAQVMQWREENRVILK